MNKAVKKNRMMKNVYAVVMAGGSGTRFWPKSIKKRPKQFLNIFGDYTMLQETVYRLGDFIKPERVMVVTNSNYESIVKEQLPELNNESIIGEPVAKNTAPCVAAAAALLHKKDPDSVMVVLPADHRIGNEDEFVRILKSAVKTAEEKESLVTIGIRPSRPETGYGYIHYDESGGGEVGDERAFAVKAFKEKPDVETALMFLNSGDYLWNSGMFIWKTSTILSAFENNLPEIYKEAKKLSESAGSERDISDFYHACPSVSVDYGIMEKANTVHVLPGDFGWSDVGSWRAVHELASKDENGNATGKSPVEIVDSSSNLVHSDSGKLISLVGVDGIGLIETEDSILVVKLDRSQDVKTVVERLKKSSEKSKYL